MDFRIKGGNTTPDLTAGEAIDIYALIKEHGTADCAMKCHHSSEFEPEHFKEVDKEADRIVSELRSNCINKTKLRLIGSVSSELLSVEEILTDDVMGDSYAEYKARNTPKEI